MSREGVGGRKFGAFGGRMQKKKRSVASPLTIPSAVTSTPAERTGRASIPSESSIVPMAGGWPPERGQTHSCVESPPVRAQGKL